MNRKPKPEDKKARRHTPIYLTDEKKGKTADPLARLRRIDETFKQQQAGVSPRRDKDKKEKTAWGEEAEDVLSILIQSHPSARPQEHQETKKEETIIIDEDEELVKFQKQKEKEKQKSKTQTLSVPVPKLPLEAARPTSPSDRNKRVPDAPRPGTEQAGKWATKAPAPARGQDQTSSSHQKKKTR